MLLARSAYAIGFCENTMRSYDPPEMFDETTQSFAIPGTQAWCDHVMDDNGFPVDAKYGSVKFVELRDVSNHVIGVLSTAQGADADHLRSWLGEFEYVPYGKLHATLVQRGYAPIVALTKCKLAGAWTDVDPLPSSPPPPPTSPVVFHSWRAATLQLDVTAGGKRLHRVKLGVGSIERRGDQVLRGHVRAKSSAIAVFAIVPSCAGPPPGYFGPDDGGDCYRKSEPVVLQLEAKSTPTVAVCF